MATTISTQDIVDAKRDIEDIGKAVNEKVIVSPRYGQPFKSLPMIAGEFQISSDAAEAAAVIAQDSAAIAQSSANIAEAAATAATISAGVFETPEAGVDPVTGVADGAYFNVRSSSDESYIDEYQNVGGVATPTGKSYPSGLAVVAVEESVEKIDTKLQREFLSVWDFFTTSEKQAYNLAILNGTSATYDSYRPVKEFFDYIAANDVGTAYCNGTFYTSKGILFGGALGSKTKQVVGDFHICAILNSTIHTLFHMQCGKELTWLGSIHVQGLGGLIFSARTVRRGLVLGGEYQCAHTYINSVNADDGFAEFGVLIDNLTTASNIEAIRVTRCGSGRINPSVGETSSWTDKTDFTVYSENTSSGLSQETVLSVTKLPPDNLKYNPILKIGGELYHVKSIDYTNSRVTIFPLLNRNNTATIARYIYGAGVATAGGDASVCRIGKINSTNCGVVYHSGALYPAVVGAITAESNTINVLLGGNSTSQAHVGGAINSLYCEASEYDIVRRTRAQLSMTVVTNYALNLNKLYDLTRVRGASSNTLDTSSVGFDGVQIAYNGKWLSWENRALANNNNISLDVTDVNRNEYWHYGSSKTFSITAPNSSINTQFGYNRKSCVVVGPGNAGNPTGDIVFNAPSGYTVNGSASVTFNGFTQAAKFDVYLQFVRNNFIVTCTTLPPTSAPSASVTYDPPSLAAAGTAGDSVTTTVTLNGAVVGDIVQAAFSRYDAGIEISAVVSAANTVLVRFKNTSAAPIDLASGNLKVKLV